MDDVIGEFVVVILGAILLTVFCVVTYGPHKAWADAKESLRKP